MVAPEGRRGRFQADRKAVRNEQTWACAALDMRGTIACRGREWNGARDETEICGRASDGVWESGCGESKGAGRADLSRGIFAEHAGSGAGRRNYVQRVGRAIVQVRKARRALSSGTALGGRGTNRDRAANLAKLE